MLEHIFFIRCAREILLRRDYAGSLRVMQKLGSYRAKFRVGHALGSSVANRHREFVFLIRNKRFPGIGRSHGVLVHRDGYAEIN